MFSLICGLWKKHDIKVKWRIILEKRKEIRMRGGCGSTVGGRYDQNVMCIYENVTVKLTMSCVKLYFPLVKINDSSVGPYNCTYS